MPENFELDRLVHALFDAVGDREDVLQVIGQVGAQLGAAAGQAFVIRKSSGEFLDSLDYVDDGIIGRADVYDRDWRQLDPRFAAAIAAPETVISDVAVLDPAAFERSAIYNEFLLGCNVRYTMFGSFSAGPDLIVAPAFMSPKSSGCFQAAEVERMTAIMPHLACALRAHQLVCSLQAENRELRAALDSCPSALLILDPRGRVLCANRTAEELLAKSDGLCTRQGVLTASQPAEASHLTAALDEAAALASRSRSRSRRPPPARSPNVRLRRERGSPLDVVLFPLSGRHDLLRAEVSSARVLAVVHDPDRATRLDPELVARLHGLTAKEAELAVALAAGRTLSNFAAEHRCSEQTARTHLKRIFSKTGFTRQTELVCALLTGAAVHVT